MGRLGSNSAQISWIVIMKIVQVKESVTPLDQIVQKEMNEYVKQRELKANSLSQQSDRAFRKWKKNKRRRARLKIRKKQVRGENIPADLRKQTKRKAYKRRKWEVNIKRLSYAEYIQSSRWRTLRGKCLKKAGRVCSRCGGKAYQAHHLTYPSCWADDCLGNLTACCGDCHALLHGKLPEDREQTAHLKVIMSSG